MNVPGFLVVGTARAGTTSLHHYLMQHPEIYLPPRKEPCFFCFAGVKPRYSHGRFAFAVTDQSRYESLFSKAGSGQMTGEISTPYLYLYRQTIDNIKKHHDSPASVKIVIVLRNPVDRAYSQYLWKVRDGRETHSFEEALRLEKHRMEMNYSFDYFYAHRGLYYEQVKAYLGFFEHVAIFRFEDFVDHFDTTMKRLCTFLGVRNDFVFTRRSPANASGTPRFPALGKIVTAESRLKFRLMSFLPEDFRLGLKERFLRWNSLSRKATPMQEATRQKLIRYYEDDIGKLQKLTGINFSNWLGA
jgi:hypothetical protein